jgi:hypothetical protein
MWGHTLQNPLGSVIFTMCGKSEERVAGIQLFSVLQLHALLFIPFEKYSYNIR